MLLHYAVRFKFDNLESKVKGIRGGVVFLPYLVLILCLPIDGMASINFLLHEDARSRNFSCLAPFFKLPP